MAHLPMDLVSDLFLRLPASTLVRCRVLSKPCISLIDSPDFVESHLKRTLETADHIMILLQCHDILRTVYLDALDKVYDIENPLQSCGLSEVFGSCNGLIGLRNSPVDIALFNPSTRKIHRLPVEHVDFRESSITREYAVYGLGYDSVSKDFKVVRMIQSVRRKVDKLFSYEIKVFSLKRNSWKKVSMHFEIQRLLFNFYHHELCCRRPNGVLASNSLHWTLPRRQGFISTNIILRFDLASEEFGVLSFPRDLTFEVDMGIGVLDGCLYLVGYNYFTHADVWIMKEYNLDGYWTKMFRVMKPESLDSLYFVRPLLYSKDMSKILLEINIGKLVWFDLASTSFETLGIKDCDGFFRAEVLVSSLVLGCNGDPRRTREKKMQKSNKRGGGSVSKGFKLKL